MTTYRDLYVRQQELQAFSAEAGHRDYSLTELELALFDELGEVNHELKPTWCWWKTGGEVNKERLLDELADVLHFLLIRDLCLAGDVIPNDAHEEIEPLMLFSAGIPIPTLWVDAIEAAQSSREDGDSAISFIDTVSDLLHQLDLHTDDLIAAYFKKTDENLRRWRAA